MAKSWWHMGLIILCGSVGRGAAHELEAVPMWQEFVDATLRAGYKDNVTLSSIEPETSPFVGVGLDAMVWRGLGEQSRFEAFVFGEHRQFLDSEQIDKEQTLFGLVQLRQDGGEKWRSGGGFEYLYQDQVVDVTATEVESQAARVRGHTFTARTDLRRSLGGGWIGIELAGERQLFEETLDDYWGVVPRVEWTLPLWEDTELELGYQYVHNWYDDDPELSETGEPIPGTRREAARHEVDLTGRQYFGGERQWRVTLKVSGRINRDNASGYYDYVRPQASARVRYRPTPGWEFEGGVRGNYYDYGVQTVSAGDAELRRRGEVYTDVLVQRRLGRRFRVFLEYSYERTVSNRTLEEYDVNTVSGGFGAEF